MILIMGYCTSPIELEPGNAYGDGDYGGPCDDGGGTGAIIGDGFGKADGWISDSRGGYAVSLSDGNGLVGMSFSFNGASQRGIVTP